MHDHQADRRGQPDRLGQPCLGRARAAPGVARWRSARSHGRMTAARIGPARDRSVRRRLRRRQSPAAGAISRRRRGGGALRLGCVEQLDRRARHHRADRVLVDQLGMPVPAQQDGKVVEPGDDALELDPVHQEHGHRRLVLSHMVQEHVLNVLRLLIGHGHDPSSCRRGCSLFRPGRAWHGHPASVTISRIPPLTQAHEAVRQGRAPRGNGDRDAPGQSHRRARRRRPAPR